MITREKLMKLHGLVPLAIIDQIDLVYYRFKINTPLRLAHFLSQCSHESMAFRVFEENLNYGRSGLLKVFGKYFNNSNVDVFVGKPKAIANFAYANRMGNGNSISGDGYTFRGRGAIQLTGKANYAEFDKFVDDDILANPDFVKTKYPLLSAAWFWDKNKINNIVDTTNTVEAVTKKVNGGLNGIEERKELFAKFYEILK